ncbi:MAG: hypothetical protein ACJ0Q6_01760 [Candidatus Azotimanducaceae bacterium]|uniref:TonB-dependent receptor n=1 Tax=OM182 bacterium TaxID=2510334 RepID=A0A520RZ74_9GAMM|nr:hypothetical protein [Gammaproteobacteria bacterium]OUV68125.1 MAG: hypothetical protein CBC93_02005 [Gammaproteobacteria bacterium TMED133]RZO75464.1 MAG: hypothetical protein EVA68_06965 [OM182 bacterium]
MKSLGRLLLAVVFCANTASALGNSKDINNEIEWIDEIEVQAKKVALDAPAGTYASVVTLLRFDPSIELQIRGLAEGQADVTTRGSLFENVGFKIGPMTILDPQTGHYAADIPIDPRLLSAPDVQLGMENTFAGFNSSIATIAYGIPQIQNGGSIRAGIGSDNLRNETLSAAFTTPGKGEANLAFQGSAAFSKGDGSVADGDHSFQRFNLQFQRVTNDSQSDIILAYQDKFFGWPGAYTGFATLAETDHTKTSLILANHRLQMTNAWLEVGGYVRTLDDDYDFDRTTKESGTTGAFDHKTHVYGIGVHGAIYRGNWDWTYALQLMSDKLIRSTDLSEGRFTSRDYLTFSLSPSLVILDANERKVILSAGASVDVSNRDSNLVSPTLGIEFFQATNRGSRYLKVEYARSSQLPGYTVLNSRPTGMFGGNAMLGRERADQASLALGFKSSTSTADLSFFYRRDRGLVDWTYSSSAPFSRQANDVDIDVIGTQLLLGYSWTKLNITAGYTFLDKDPNYGEAAVDASFYALNFARHRATIAMQYQITEQIEFRLDNEYRLQEKNPLRDSSAESYLGSASIIWAPDAINGLTISSSVENMLDEDFQQFPGTPASGRQFSLNFQYER